MPCLSKRSGINCVFFPCPIGPIPMMIGAEVFRQGPRPLAMAIGGFFNWVGTFVIAIGFESVAVSKRLNLKGGQGCEGQ